MSRVWVGYGSSSRGCGNCGKLGAGGLAADWSIAQSFPRGVGTSGKMIKRNSASFDRFHRFHTAAVSTALVFRADSCLRRRDAQTESMDTGEAIRDRNGDGAGEGIHFGTSEEGSGFGGVETSVRGGVFGGGRRGFFEGGRAALAMDGGDKYRSQTEALKGQIEELQRVIGEQSVEIRFLKKLSRGST